ncbi:hypothetical protein OUZ56_017494 [Daphnia magna]|uniref:Uncharacterized protein n=1 Tax=Daphnia magna TaxID=35525 RepID=A0ABR0ASY2_9CRUS|nr:hypothetical protein OUZ56_017494 [Daphnia magna]
MFARHEATTYFASQIELLFHIVAPSRANGTAKTNSIHSSVTCSWQRLRLFWTGFGLSVCVLPRGGKLAPAEYLCFLPSVNPYSTFLPSDVESASNICQDICVLHAGSSKGIICLVITLEVQWMCETKLKFNDPVLILCPGWHVYRDVVSCLTSSSDSRDLGWCCASWWRAGDLLHSGKAHETRSRFPFRIGGNSYLAPVSETTSAPEEERCRAGPVKDISSLEGEERTAGYQASHVFRLVFQGEASGNYSWWLLSKLVPGIALPSYFPKSWTALTGGLRRRHRRQFLYFHRRIHQSAPSRLASLEARVQKMDPASAYLSLQSPLIHGSRRYSPNWQHSWMLVSEPRRMVSCGAALDICSLTVGSLQGEELSNPGDGPDIVIISEAACSRLQPAGPRRKTGPLRDWEGCKIRLKNFHTQCPVG